MIGTAAFSVDTKTTGNGITVIEVVGDLDLFVAPQLRQALLDALAGGSPPLILIDVSGLAFMDSTGLGLIIGGHKRTKARGGMLALGGVTAYIAALLRVTGLTHIFSPYTSVDEALAALASGETPCRR